MKLRYTILISITMLFILSSCSNDSPNGEKKLLSSNITEVSVAKSAGLGGLNKDSFVTFKDSNTTEAFEKAMKNAEKQADENVTIEPEYDLIVEYKKDRDTSTRGVHLWLGERGVQSTLMYIGDDAVYKLTMESSKRLREIILKQLPKTNKM